MTWEWWAGNFDDVPLSPAGRSVLIWAVVEKGKSMYNVGRGCLLASQAAA